MSLKKDTDLSFVERFYDGVYESCARHGLRIIGGDTAHGTELVFNITMLGSAKRADVRLRSMAVSGDLSCVTGTLGKSAAGLALLQHNLEGDCSGFLKPRSRSVREGQLIARYAHAMIDVSDGLGSEVHHICEQSGTGAIVYAKCIPLSDATQGAVQYLSTPPQDIALYGGEDFELVFTLSPPSEKELRNKFLDYTPVGKIVDLWRGMHLDNKGLCTPLHQGFDHFP